MKITTTFAEWLAVANCSGFQMREFERPAFVANVRTMENLDNITFGQLIQLSELDGSDEAFFIICEVLLNLTREQTRKARAIDVVRFVGWVTKEIKKIGALFERVNIKPTKQEIMAGIDRLQFGLFGVIDWYAQRQGIQNHNDVLQVNWLQVWKCMDMDAQKILYNRRYNQVIENEQRRNSKAHH